jgi:hypothetical protein
MTYQHTRIYNIFLGKLRQEVGFESETLLHNLDIERNIIFKIDKRYIKIKSFMCGLLLKTKNRNMVMINQKSLGVLVLTLQTLTP